MRSKVLSRRIPLVTRAVVLAALAGLVISVVRSEAVAATAYVVNRGSDTVTPINTSTNAAGTAITVGPNPNAIAITPNGKTAYVVTTTDKVVPITTATNKAGKPITVPGGHVIAITPNGRTAYIVSTPDPDSEQGVVVPIRVAANTPGKPIRVGSGLQQIVISPDGKTAYITNLGPPPTSALAR